MRRLRLLPALVLPVVLFVGCGDDAASSNAKTETSGTATATSDTADSPTSTTVAAASDKPTVDIPDTLPTELVITDLIEGTGEPAKNGDTVEVNYVGVRSADGAEFDNSYDRGSTFPVTLGRGSVIEGWEQGLIGIKAGGRRQLDIPADLAYGDSPQGDVIKAGDALSFVIDAVSVTPGVEVPTADAADKPDISIAPTPTVTETTFEDLVVGDGEEAVAGATAYLQIIAYRGDTGAEIQSSWEAGDAVELPLTAETLPGLVEGVTGMKVGGRRQVTIAPADAFGDTGNESLGLPGNTPLIMVVDLVQLKPAAG